MKNTLINAVKAAQDNLNIAKNALAEFESKSENNVFDTMELAISTIEGKLESQACDDCEGSGNCGSETYTQEFMVEGIVYVGVLTVEYDRHDKQYYYVDGTDFNVKKK